VKITEYIKNKGITPQEAPEYTDTASMYFGVTNGYDSLKINIIALTPRIHKCWKEASQMMLAAPESITKDRGVRRYTFTMLVDMLAHFVHKRN
jgi:hypothetical protein